MTIAENYCLQRNVLEVASDDEQTSVLDLYCLGCTSHKVVHSLVHLTFALLLALMLPDLGGVVCMSLSSDLEYPDLDCACTLLPYDFLNISLEYLDLCIRNVDSTTTVLCLDQVTLMPDLEKETEFFDLEHCISEIQDLEVFLSGSDLEDFVHILDHNPSLLSDLDL